MALDRFEQNHRTELAAHEDYDRWRACARDTKGRVLKGNTKPFTPPELPEGVINLADPDARVMRTQGTPPRQAYNAQTAVNEQQIILAAEITIDAPDFGHLEPMLDTTLKHLAKHGVSELPEVVLGDAGYLVDGTLLQASRLAPLPDGAHRLAAANPVFLLWAQPGPDHDHGRFGAP